MHVTPPLSEALFQHIWKCRLYRQEGLVTTNGEAIQVIHPGTHNHHSGPDFTGARIKIGTVLWAGPVELHLRSSDWYRHGHAGNAQYGQIILHVVYVHDLPAGIGGYIRCLELQPYISNLLLQRYEELRLSAAFVPCSAHAGRVPPLVWASWQDRLLAQRWERRQQELLHWLSLNRYDWEETCYWAVARSYGAPVNAPAFLALAQSLPYRLLQQYLDQPLATEALLFGQAGLLEDTFSDVYPLQLQREYRRLQMQHRLEPLPAHSWRWLRMRPPSFPSIRIATLAALLQRHRRLFAGMLDVAARRELEQLFFVHPSPYWRSHYRFQHLVAQTRLPGRQALHAVLINSVLPLLHLYGRCWHRPDYQELALTLLQELPPEDNHIIRAWEQLGVPAGQALGTQAMLELKQQYCEQKRCLECAVGTRILSQR
ncbi:DUF2851 family protein [Chitinophaga qingshengii]|uniref:DUF2851 family protein n=1 Tax=Chitinophaga qingshengii TaxID=1569794 RepID=A0ABR7TLU0_9BACT|nr:DUF2851 family protein [Chitinophaga qingshengii]MBC9930389.1 DUF2851 family protein [Chitinophaga qingshengii]